MFTSALSQTWPPFVLVTGLLLIGQVAASDGNFAAIGARLASLPGNGRVLYVAMMGLVAGVTVILNLDTSIVFLTPIVLHAARRRGYDERAFLYGTIFMSNSASLLLPSSNLTNLLVVSKIHVNGARFAGAMLPAWMFVVAFTALVIVAWQWRELSSRTLVDLESAPMHYGFGILGIVVAMTLVLFLAQPALAIFVLGVALVAAQTFVARRMQLRSTLRAANLELLAGLFSIAVLAGVIARAWSAPHHVMRELGTYATAFFSGGVANIINNLPATLLLSSERPIHPQALLMGLDLGPNLAVFGAMSSLLWLRIAKSEGARPSVATFSRLGLIIAPLTILIGTAVSEYLFIGHF